MVTDVQRESAHINAGDDVLFAHVEQIYYYRKLDCRNPYVINMLAPTSGWTCGKCKLKAKRLLGAGGMFCSFAMLMWGAAT